MNIIEKGKKMGRLSEELDDYKKYKHVLSFSQPRVKLGNTRNGYDILFESWHTKKFIPVIEEIILELEQELKNLMES